MISPQTINLGIMLLCINI